MCLKNQIFDFLITIQEYANELIAIFYIFLKDNLITFNLRPIRPLWHFWFSGYSLLSKKDARNYSFRTLRDPYKNIIYARNRTVGTCIWDLGAGLNKTFLLTDTDYVLVT